MDVSLTSAPITPWGGMWPNLEIVRKDNLSSGSSRSSSSND